MAKSPLYKVLVAGQLYLTILLALALGTWMTGTHLYKEQQIDKLKAELEQAKEANSQMVQLAFGAKVDAEALKTLEVTVTSYNPLPSQGWGTGLVTADGNLAKPGVLAVSHDLLHEYGLQLGQQVVLNGYGTFIVGDLMHKRWKRKVDIISFIPNWSKKFGVKKAVLYYATPLSV